MTQRGRPTRRAGFTFIEILMVVAIIALLVALLLAGISKVLALQGRTENASDILQMTKSLNVAKIEYGKADYLPGKLVLYNEIGRYFPPEIDKAAKVDQSPVHKKWVRQTADVLRQMFGKRLLDKANWTNPNIHWGGDTPPMVARANSPQGIILDGPEALVFFLGGNFEGNKMVGFAKDPTNPTRTTGQTSERLGPFFAFRPNRLAPAANGMPHYLDPYGIPYIYFGAVSSNEYDDTHAYVGLFPYFVQGSNPKKWMNPDSFQIISAGKDKVGGSGGPLVVSKDAPARTDDPSLDNLTNFSQTELGNSVE